MNTKNAKEVRKLKTPLLILLIAMLLFLAAYFFTGGRLFRGLIFTDTDLQEQDREMDKIVNYVTVVSDGGGEPWPIQTGRETVFEVNEEASAAVAFLSKQGYGTWRVLRADFKTSVANESENTYTFQDASSSEGTEITEICIDFDDGSKECFNNGEEVSHDYTTPGTYHVTFTAKDADGRSDSVTKDISVTSQEDQGGGQPAEGGTERPAEGDVGRHNSIPAQLPPRPLLTANFEHSEVDPGDAGAAVDFYNKTTPYDNLKKVIWSFNDESDETVIEFSRNDESIWNTTDQNGDDRYGDYAPYIFPYPPGNGAGAYSKDYQITLNAWDDTDQTAEVKRGLTIHKPIKAAFSCEKDANKDGTIYHIVLKDQSEIPYGGAKTYQVDVNGDGHPDEPTQNGFFTFQDVTSVIATYIATHTPSRVSDTLADIDLLAKCQDNPDLIATTAWSKSLMASTFNGNFKNPTAAPVDESDTVDEEVVITAEAKTAAERQKFDTVIAKSGSTVYFEANCLTDEQLEGNWEVQIVPRTTLRTNNGVPKDFERALINNDLLKIKNQTISQFDLELLEGVENTLRQKAAQLDIFKNEDACVEAPVQPAAEGPPKEPEFTAKCLVDPEQGEPGDTFILIVVASEASDSFTFEYGDDSEKEEYDLDGVRITYQTKHVYSKAGEYTFTGSANAKENNDTCNAIIKVGTPLEEPPLDEPPKEEDLGIPEITKPEPNQVFTHDPRMVDIDWTEVKNATAYDLELACDWCKSNTDKWTDPWTNESTETAYSPGALPGDGEYRVRARAKNAEKNGEWSGYTYFSFDTAEKYECNDGIDNDDDGYIDFGTDPGCESPEDDTETNPPARIVTVCSDGLDNDDDGFTDTEDPGCEDANDINEENEVEEVAQGLAIRQFCHDPIDPKEFADITDDDFEQIVLDIIEEEASTAYNRAPFDGEAIFIGYPQSELTVFKPHQPIRRDEVIKILTLATCLPEHLQSLGEYSLNPVDFDEPEFNNPDYWASDYIFMNKNAEIIDKANVGANVKRSEFLKMLTNIHGKVTGDEAAGCNDKEIPFVDVKKTNWFCPYAMKAHEIGIIQDGFKDKHGNLRLNPNSILTRLDAAIWLRNYYVSVTGSSFADTLSEPAGILPIKIER